MNTAFSQQIYHLGEREGIKGNQTFNIVQDKKGFKWMSTRFGIDRFDGENIKYYPIDILYNNMPIRITKLFIDNDSLPWVYTDRGTIYKYNEPSDRFICYKNFQFFIRSVTFDSDNNLWIARWSDVSILKNDTLQTIVKFTKQREQIRSIQYIHNKNLQITTNQNIYIYDITSGYLKTIIEDKKMPLPLEIESCFYDPDVNYYWIGTTNKGLFFYDSHTKLLSQVKDERLYNHPILSINVLDKNFILIGTDGLGLHIFNKDTKSIEKTYSNTNSDKLQINSNVIYDIYKDEQEKIWLSTFTDGVNILDFGKQGFNILISGKRNTQNIICSVIEDSNRNLWLTTPNGIDVWNRKKNNWKTVLSSKNVLTIYEDSQKNIWAGTYSNGVYLLNQQGEILANYQKNTNTNKCIGTNFVYTVCEDSNNNLWFGGKKGVVSKYDSKRNEFTQIDLVHANYITQMNKNFMLVLSESGAYQVSLDAKSVKECSFNKNLKSKYICDVFIESDSIVWLSTYGDGINRCNLQTGTVTHFTQREGLPSNIIYALQVDGNKIWFSSENGLGNLDLLTHEIKNYSITDGLSSNRFRQLSRAKGFDNTLYFGSYNGITYFSPEKINKKESSSRLFIQEFRLFNKTTKSGDKDSPLINSIDNTSSINLNYKQHSFSFDFTAIHFSLGEKRLYRWKLEGLDNEWNEPTDEHIANYTNIVPGNYIFHVQYLSDNLTVLDERLINITLSPPFWKTFWAYILICLIIVSLTYLTLRYIYERMKKKQFEEKIKFFLNTAHDIRTPLTLINSPMYQLKEEIAPNPQNNYLISLIINNLDKLNRMFNQLLDFQKAYEAQDKLIIKKHEINKYLIEKSEYWKPSAHKKNIDLKLILSENEFKVWFDEDKMDKILDNLISNAIKYTPQNGHIKITIFSNANNWGIVILDDGIGVPKGEKSNLFKRFHRGSNAVNSQISGSGLGLLLVKEYVGMHKGIVKVNSNENQGSEFSIQFKHGYNHLLKTNNIVIDQDNIPMDDEKPVMNGNMNANELKIKLLIVEDNGDLRNYLKLSLGHNYITHVATDGLEAWENILKINPDIIISDLQMPNMDGLELCHKVKTTFETSHIPIILLTVINTKDAVERGFSVGVDDYIEKPFDLKLLSLKIDNIIRNRKLLRLKFLGINKSEIDVKESPENQLNVEFIDKATQIIENHINEPSFSIAQFSKEMGLSRSLLYTKFNSITGYTPSDFIKLIRMNKAIEYFREKRYLINEVAYMVGFDDHAYFTNCFKKIYGKSPKEFIDENIK